jgi:hypothetical protein
MVVVDGPLLLSHRSPVDGRPLATVCVRSFNYFHVGSTEIISAPNTHKHLEGRFYQTLGDAKYVLRQALNISEVSFCAYVIGEFDRSLLGTDTGQALLDCTPAPYSPQLAMAHVETRRVEDGQGCWVPWRHLTPFVPDGTPAHEAQREMQRRVNQVRCR